jgi:hypothetical protein
MLSTVRRFIYTKYWGILYIEHCGNIHLHKILRNTFVEHCGKIYLYKILRNTVCWTLGRFIYTKYWGILYVEHCEKSYLLNIPRNTVCWALWEDLFTQNTEEYCMLSTEGRFIYTKYWGILYVEHCGKIYLHIIVRNTLCLTLWEYLFTQNTGEYFVEYNGNFDLHTILGITLCWALWENSFTQNTGDYFMLNPVGRFIYTKYWGILYVEHCEKIYLHKILYTEHRGKIYLHKILRNIVCWALWEDLFTHNTEEYFMLNTVRRFIHTKYWGILYVEHCGKIYLHKILIILYVKHCDKIYLHKLLRNTVCWALWEDLFTQNTGEYFLLYTVGIFIYIKYWEILYVEHWENWFTQNTRDYFMLNAVGRFIYTKYWGILYVEHCGKIYLHKIQRNNVCLSTVGIFILTYTKYWGILYIEHWENLFAQHTEEYFMLNSGNIYLHKILRNTLCWALWKDLFTRNTEE